MKVIKHPLVPLFIALTMALGILSGRAVMAKGAKSIEVGDKAPEFSLPSQDGGTVSLKDFAGKKTVVLYFYPKDNTAVCTKEACLFRDSYQDFTDAGAEVIGVSSDSAESHKGFASEHKLPFKLLSDDKGEVRKLYGVHSTMGVMPGRVTYVIDPKGIVRLKFVSQLDAKKHVDKALTMIKDIEKEAGKEEGKEKASG